MTVPLSVGCFEEFIRHSISLLYHLSRKAVFEIILLYIFSAKDLIRVSSWAENGCIYAENGYILL